MKINMGKINKNAKSKVVLLIALFTFSSALAFTTFTSTVKADDPSYPAGVIDQGADLLGSGYVLNYRIAIDGNHHQIGLISNISHPEVDHQLVFHGPVRNEAVDPYIKNVDLTWAIYGEYRPFIVLRSSSWYDHYFELCNSLASTVTFTLDIGVGYDSSFFDVGYEFGWEWTTITSSSSRWELTVDNSQTAVVYFWVTFLRVNGTIAYFNDEIRPYDAIALQNVDTFNKYIVTYDMNETISELPSQLNDTCYGGDSPEKFYMLSDKDTMEWSESSSYSWHVGLSLKIGGDASLFWWGGFYFSVKVKAVDTDVTTAKLVHSFTPVAGQSRPLDYFYFVFENSYSTNLVAEQDPVATIVSPTSGSTLWDETEVQVNGQDNIEVESASLWVSPSPYYVEYAEIQNPTRIDNNWYFEFDSRNFEDGTWYLHAIVYDNYGGSGMTNFSVEIKNDSWGQITRPTASSTKLYGDDIIFSATANDNSGVSSVKFQVERISGSPWSSPWNNAYYNELLYQGWYWIWYDQPSTGTYKLHCKIIDTFGYETEINSVVFYVDYGIMYTTSVQNIKGVYQVGGTTEGKYNDDVYYGIKTDADGWLWWRSITRFNFNDPGGAVVSTHFEFQIQPCTSELLVRIKYIGDSSVGGWIVKSYSSSGIQSVSLDANKRVQYVEISQHVYWTTQTRLWIDFGWVRYRTY